MVAYCLRDADVSWTSWGISTSRPRAPVLDAAGREDGAVEALGGGARPDAGIGGVAVGGKRPAARKDANKELSPVSGGGTIAGGGAAGPEGVGIGAGVATTG